MPCGGGLIGSLASHGSGSLGPTECQLPFSRIHRVLHILIHWIFPKTLCGAHGYRSHFPQ